MLGGMSRLLFTSVICLSVFSATYPVTRAATPVEKAALQLTTEIVRQRYCTGDGELDGLDLELRLRYRNVGSRPLILYKGSEYIYLMKISPSLAAAAGGEYEVNAALTWYTDGGVRKMRESSLNRMFIILSPGETYGAKTHARVLVTRAGVSGRIEGSVGDGEHYLQVTIPTWHGSQASADRLRKKWSGRGFLWTKAVTSLPMKFIVEPERTAANCE